MIKTPAIVIVAYNRKKSFQRLLKSIENANYSKNNITLIISIDFAIDNSEIIKIANLFEWKYGSKKVISHQENLGLRKHIIECGGYASTYGAVIILEDDLYVSPNFYQYTLSALEFASDKQYIAGISLYNHQYNVHCRSNFSPLIDGYDNWYFQFASSWGQAWTKNQWERFFKWYQQQGTLIPNQKLPKNVTSWSEKSWLKFFIAFLVESNSYFLYPRTSFSTNFSDTGTHIGQDTTTFQVPLNFSKNPKFNFSTLQESNSVYDAFYENQKLYKYLNISKSELLVNLYGKKKLNEELRYMLTDKILHFKVIKSFGRSLKPHDANILKQLPGDDLFLYDCQTKIKHSKKIDVYRKIIYDIKGLNLNEAKIVFFKKLQELIILSLKKIRF